VPTVLTLSDGSTTLNLANTGFGTIHLVSITGATTQRKTQRVGPTAQMVGQRTVASALDDTEITITCNIWGTTTDSVEDRLRVLVQLLDKARIWEEERTGAPVRLQLQRSGATNAAYYTVTGVTRWPTPTDATEWVDLALVNKTLEFSFSISVEPNGHATGVSGVAIATGIPLVTHSNTITGLSVIGDQPMPCAISVQNASGSGGNNWTTMWILLAGDATDITKFSGTADASASGAVAQAATITGTVSTFTGSGYTIDTSYQFPIRCFLRLKVTSGTASKLMLSLTVKLGNTTVITLPAVAYTGTSGNYLMVDLGEIGRITGTLNRTGQLSGQYFTTLNLWTSDGSSVGVNLDYAEFVPYRGMVKLTGLNVAQNETVYYEDIQTLGTYTWPRQTPQAYQVSNVGVLQYNAIRAGRLPWLPAGVVPYFWIQAQSDSLHRIADAMSVIGTGLAMYSLGLNVGF
jgi:hypothetical protein